LDRKIWRVGMRATPVLEEDYRGRQSFLGSNVVVLYDDFSMSMAANVAFGETGGDGAFGTLPNPERW
jgi:hypothetical protein